MNAWLKKISKSAVWDWVWAGFFLLLPVTSMPAVIRLVKSDVVAAPSGVLLAVILLGWCLPLLLTGTSVSRNTIPLLVFLLAAILCTLLAFFCQIPDYKGRDQVSGSLAAILTLLVGFGFFFAVMLRSREINAAETALRLINISGAVVIFWTLLQAFYWFTDHRYPEWMQSIQFFFSAGSLYRQRFVGFTLEPSWLAHQLNLLYLPWWFAATVERASVHRRKFGNLTVENILFVFGVLILFLTLSRIGLAAFSLTVFYWLVTRGYRILEKKYSLNQKSILARIWAISLMLLFFALILLLAVWLLTKLDFRMAGLFSVRLAGREHPFMVLAEELGMASRFVYWDAGWRIFNKFPFWGVGLGNAGAFIPQNLNSFALQLEEVRRLLFRSEIILNIKSLWIRLLAETGLSGFSLFLGWLLSTFGIAQLQMKKTSNLRRASGLMGVLVLIAFGMEGFSVDTFALPYFWVSLGIMSGVASNEVRI